MFEIDLIKSTDGVLYLFHDGEEKRLLGIDKSIKTLSSGEIDNLMYLNSICHTSGVRIQRFEDMVSYFKNGELYNVDRAWDFLPEATGILKKYPWAVNQALIKTPVDDKILSFFSNCPEKYMYMPIVRSMEDVETVLSYTNINLVGMELIAHTPDDELFFDSNIRYIKDKCLFIWANAIVLSNSSRHVLFGGLEDDLALKGHEDKSWGVMFKKGVNTIQTDWPFQLKEYREYYFKSGCKH